MLTKIKELAIWWILPFQCENERKRINKQILGSCLSAEQVVEHEGEGDTKCS